ncbi:hypothetical protein CHCC15337_3703 [Bacillus paralicheniformis]|jgi:hypothetical protein|nr:hypothetical protein LI7559_02680 [Bacillus licheniformis LMG 7559]TWJ59996.1 hypothetical protein CHCC5021_3185 [Bacillus paralicheniformis]TWL11259.1 hypothetical protein CHCC19468_2093 [Bacillus paralicheniformis]TWL20304.1 hypothetical protein CHCC19467_3546 [Bacillus paralicheniformis]TWL45935.1 hypothetical protein CHCC15337_3703 [Bacillus paralicheniformis]
MNETKQKTHPPAVEERFAKGCLFGILFSLPFWLMFYLFLQYTLIR